MICGMSRELLDAMALHDALRAERDLELAALCA